MFNIVDFRINMSFVEIYRVYDVYDVCDVRTQPRFERLLTEYRKYGKFVERIVVFGGPKCNQISSKFGGTIDDLKTNYPFWYCLYLENIFNDYIQYVNTFVNNSFFSNTPNMFKGLSEDLEKILQCGLKENTITVIDNKYVVKKIFSLSICLGLIQN